MTSDRELQRIGRRVLRFDTLDSTNTHAQNYAADPVNDGLVILAEEQTAGRGRQGRRWLSPPGCSVLMSVLLFPPQRLRQPVLLTVLAAVAVCETILHCARLQSVIKWPNDVLIHERKVCGILVEQGQATVIGIGLNVNTPAAVFMAAELADAGSLALFTKEPLDRSHVTETLLQMLDNGYADLLAGRSDDLEERWRRCSGLVGRQATLKTADSRHTGRVVDLRFECVTLQDEQGIVRRFSPETILQITPHAAPAS